MDDNDVELLAIDKTARTKYNDITGTAAADWLDRMRDAYPLADAGR